MFFSTQHLILPAAKDNVTTLSVVYPEDQKQSDMRNWNYSITSMPYTENWGSVEDRKTLTFIVLCY